MKEYICTVCGYIHKTEGELPDGFICPVCSADKSAFMLKESTAPEQSDRGNGNIEKPHTETELSAMEMSIICSNLARGCEKQYMQKESEEFSRLAEFFRSECEPQKRADIDELLKTVEEDLSSGFPYAFDAAERHHDRGALRCLTWAQKVTRMLESLLKRYKSQGDSMLENTGVYVCTICGFIFIGDTPPEICPVCKVPSWKFEKQERRVS